MISCQSFANFEIDRCCSHEKLGCPGYVYHGADAGAFKKVAWWSPKAG